MGIWFVLAGVIGGVFGGMGLGGGTLLIPILTLFLGVDARVAAWLNLLTFLPMSVVTLIIHSKNGLVAWTEASAFVPTAFVSTAVFSVFSSAVEGAVLKRYFGWFLVLVGSISIVISLVRSAQKKKSGAFRKNTIQM